MGSVPTITAKAFPRQSDKIGKKVKVCFHYDMSEQLNGTIVREDFEEPFVTIIKLEDNRYVLATECMYQPL